ncbi:MAG: type II toxin-antitoxin system prevent-host-death family antitoxin [Pseudomonadota bacterium]
MKELVLTKVKQDFGHLVSMAEKEPLTISDQGEKKAVILSFSRYDELKKFEDALYGKAAILAIEEGLASEDAVSELLDSID